MVRLVYLLFLRSYTVSLINRGTQTLSQEEAMRLVDATLCLPMGPLGENHVMRRREPAWRVHGPADRLAKRGEYSEARNNRFRRHRQAGTCAVATPCFKCTVQLRELLNAPMSSLIVTPCDCELLKPARWCPILLYSAQYQGKSLHYTSYDGLIAEKAPYVCDLLEVIANSTGDITGTAGVSIKALTAGTPK